MLPWPEWWTPALAWEDLSAVDRRALTELLVDKIIIAPHPHKIDKDGGRHLASVRSRNTRSGHRVFSVATWLGLVRARAYWVGCEEKFWPRGPRGVVPAETTLP